jgi:hypothetical protein
MLFRYPVVFLSVSLAFIPPRNYFDIWLTSFYVSGFCALKIVNKIVEFFDCKVE